MNPSVTVYTSVVCPVCKMVKNFLDTSEIAYKEVNVDINPVAMMKLISKTKRIGVPQTNINGTWIPGFDPLKMMQTLNNTAH